MNRDTQIDFEKMEGLAPAIIQDDQTGEILMLGFLNAESLRMTLANGFVTFYSRTRQTLWTKGETSGNRLQVISASTDCDRDAVLFKVRVLGDGVVCHEGTRSCFTRPLAISGPSGPTGSSATGAPASRKSVSRGDSQ